MICYHLSLFVPSSKPLLKGSASEHRPKTPFSALAPTEGAGGVGLTCCGVLWRAAEGRAGLLRDQEGC